MSTDFSWPEFLQVSFLGAVRRAAVCDLEEEQDEHNGQAGQHHHGQEPGQGGQGGRQGDERVQGSKSLFSLLVSISVSYQQMLSQHLRWRAKPSEDESYSGSQLHVQVWKAEVDHQHPQHSRREEQVGGGQRGLWGGGRGGVDRVEGRGWGQSDCENEEGPGWSGRGKCCGTNQEVELSDASAVGALLPRAERSRWEGGSCLDAGEEQECLPQTKVGGDFNLSYICQMHSLKPQPNNTLEMKETSASGTIFISFCFFDSFSKQNNK